MKRFFSKIYILTLKPIVYSLLFLFTLLTFILVKTLEQFAKWCPCPKKMKEKMTSMAYKIYDFIAQINRHQQGTISRMSLISLAFKNMSAKKSRTLITVGGMAVGIGTIVFLVSLGYGIQELVVSRVARLDEMKQINVSPQPGSKVKINDESIARFKNIDEIEESLPMISVVGSVNYQNSVSDMAVYGVTSRYLKDSAITPIEGTIFESNELTINRTTENDKGSEAMLREENVRVAADTIENFDSFEIGQKIANVHFSIDPGIWMRVRSGPSIEDKIIGYTKRAEGHCDGTLVVGSTFKKDSNDGGKDTKRKNKEKTEWIKAKVHIWDKKECNEGTNIDCVNGRFIVQRDTNNDRIQKEGYLAKIEMSVDIVEDHTKKGPKVLGIEVSTETIDISELNLEGSGIEDVKKDAEDIKEVSIDQSAIKEAVVNRAMLKVLNIKKEEAVGKNFDVSFEAVGSLLENPDEKVKSALTTYRIVGVTPDEKIPLFYVPFVDLRAIGIINYSQVKIITENKETIAETRKKIEAMGYSTNSVVDTVNQINDLFQTVRIVLTLVGMVALAVASLGMFNTLTVSLLERTREVGLMKSMGMKSYEIKELFMVESLLMGFFGGVMGLLLGFLAGKSLGFILSMFSLFKGVGVLDITHIPLFFIVVILFLSLFVGVITGIYPAQRAKKMSALNALRYE